MKNMIKNRAGGQSGFSLLEAVIVTVLTIFVFAAFGTFLMKFTKSAASYNESAKQSAESGLSMQTVNDDLERAGSNLTFSQKQSFTGEIYVPFNNDYSYIFNGHRISSRRGRPGEAIESNILWSGKGQLKWFGDRFHVSSFDGSSSREIISYGTYIEVIDNGTIVARNALISQSPLFSITLSSFIVNEISSCRINYAIDGTTIFENVIPCSEQPQKISLQLSNGFIDEMKINAAQITLREPTVMPVHQALLPLYNGTRMEIPFVRTDFGFVVLSGDREIDAMFLRSDVLFRDSVYIFLNDSSNVKTGDTLLVCDFLNKRSILLHVESSGESGDVFVTPITEPRDYGNGFGKFYSAFEDFQDAIFSKGTRVVKLAAPVEYGVNQDNNINSLYRRVGNSAWELVAPNIQNFDFRSDVQSSNVTFSVLFDVLNENIENEQNAQTVRIAVNPRSLNRTFDTR